MYNVTQLKQLFQAQIAPGEADEFLRLLQEAEIRLLETGKWQWSRERATLTPVNGVITLAPEHAAIIGAQIEGYPSPIHAMDYEFSPDGPGEIEVRGCMGVNLIDQGLNPDEERYYKVTGHDNDDIGIVALVHKAPAVLYDPDITDPAPAGATMYATCPDAGAIKLTMLAIIFEEAHDLAASRNYMGTAYARLNDREKTRRGNAQQVPNIRPMGRGVRRIRNLR